MAFHVSEIRRHAERLKTAIAVERYETRAGLKERPDFAGIYAEHRFLLAPEALSAIQRDLAEVGGDGRRRLLHLHGWVARQRVEADLAPLEDQLRAWEAGTIVSFEGRQIPLRRVLAALGRLDSRPARLELEAERIRRIEEASALRLDVLHREREAVVQLGLGSYVEAQERLTGLDLRGLERYAVEILTRTDAPYREAFLREVGRRIGAEARAAARSDAIWLMGMRWHSRAFAINPLLTAIRRDLDKLGVPLVRKGVRIDLERRPLKESDSFCAPIRVPGDVVLVISPRGGWADARGMLHEVGHALHFTHTDPDLPFEVRALGDTSVTESVGLLFESLTLNRVWVEDTTDLTGAALDEYLRLAGFLQLYRLRRHAAHFLWEMELAASDRPGELSSRYAELMTEATGFAHDPVTFIEDVRRGFWVARQVRAWMLSAIMLDALHDRFGAGWVRDPTAGRFLSEIFSSGQREDAAQLATQLAEARLRPGTLIERTIQWIE